MAAWKDLGDSRARGRRLLGVFIVGAGGMEGRRPSTSPGLMAPACAPRRRRRPPPWGTSVEVAGGGLSCFLERIPGPVGTGPAGAAPLFCRESQRLRRRFWAHPGGPRDRWAGRGPVRIATCLRRSSASPSRLPKRSARGRQTEGGLPDGLRYVAPSGGLSPAGWGRRRLSTRLSAVSRGGRPPGRPAPGPLPPS